MMKRITALLLALMVALTLCCTAFGAALSDEDGIYGVQNKTGGSLSNFKTEKNVSAEVVSGSFYTDACRFKVERTGLANGNQYILYILSSQWAPTVDNIVYINQQVSANGKVVFEDAYPSTMHSGTYYVYVAGTGITAGTLLASFQYQRVARFTLKVKTPAMGSDAVTVLRGSVDLGTGTSVGGVTQWVDTKIGTYTISSPGLLSWTGKIDVTEGSEKTITLVAGGDANGDGKIDVEDMQALYDYLSVSSRPDAFASDETYFSTVSDANGDDEVNILDYQWIYEEYLKNPQ